jgi:glycosyltransferase involved in cell wall biosynthesis
MSEKRSPAGSRDRLRALYICYLSLEDPLVHTQVVAYLSGLAGRGHTIHLLTFETSRLTRDRRLAARSELARLGIVWHGLRYHKRPTLLATGADVLTGGICAAWLLHRHRLKAVHARSHVPAAMALLARAAARFRLIFDIRGLMAEEYEDAGRWRRDSLPFRLAKAVERRALKRADGVVVLTERVRQYLFGDQEAPSVQVIPCCADTERIEAGRDGRDTMRARLGLDGRTVLVYVGKFTGWYMEREMVEFFAIARDRRPDMHFLILTQSEPELVQREFERVGIEQTSWTITHCQPALIGQYLAAADAGIAFIRPSFSKISSSPTKVGEYLAAGLPLICISGVGDVDELLRSHRVGVLLNRWEPSSLARGAEALERLIGDPDAGERARFAAREKLSLATTGIPAYDALYRDLASLRPAPWRVRR